MKFTNKTLEKMDKKKKEFNSCYSDYYYGMFKEFNQKKYKNKSDNINDCMNLWLWDKYEKNKILDLQKVNRCHNNRFCPNCKLLDISKFIHEFRKNYSNLIKEGYKAYMLTLTIPSIPGNDLRATLDKLNKTFLKLIEKYTYDDKRAYSDRFFKIEGGIKVLEITYNSYNGFHPHFHCVILVRDDISKELLEKKYRGKWSNKRQSYNMKSEIDCQFGKIWSMLWYKERLTLKNINNIDYNPAETYYNKKENKKCLEVDFTELDEKGIYEVFKYTFKDSDIENYYVFKTLVQALENKRIRQGFGILYNMKCEDIESGEVQELILEIKENPVSILTYEINELITVYRDYKKISRFNPNLDLEVEKN